METPASSFKLRANAPEGRKQFPIRLKLESLERIVSAPDQRQLAEASLAAFREVAAGEHFSAMLFNTKGRTVDAYFLNHGWLASNNMFWQSAQQRLADHPLAERFLSRHQSMSLVRSRVVSDTDWKKTWLYNEVERPLGVEDITTVCQIMANNQVLILTCGRSRRFSDRDLDPIQSYQRVLDGLVPFRTGGLMPHRSRPGVSGGTNTRSLLVTLTAREHEILHWVREGKRDPEIGIILGISPRTVHHHVASIYHKLGVETRTAAAVFQ